MGQKRGLGFYALAAFFALFAVARTVGGLEELDDAIFAATGRRLRDVPLKNLGYTMV